MLNLPNQITIARLIVSLLVFIFTPWQWFLTALVFFVIAASTDWADGYLARKHGLVTQLGRILDPFADKILICGIFIFLSAEPNSRVPAGIAVLVVGRELLVTALRSFLEQQGADFSASMAGKLKMVFQCGAAALSLFLLSYGTTGTTGTPGAGAPHGLQIATTTMVWLAAISTVYSGAGYVVSATRLLRRGVQ